MFAYNTHENLNKRFLMQFSFQKGKISFFPFMNIKTRTLNSDNLIKIIRIPIIYN